MNTGMNEIQNGDDLSAAIDLGMVWAQCSSTSLLGQPLKVSGAYAGRMVKVDGMHAQSGIPGRFVGEIGYLTGRLAIPAGCKPNMAVWETRLVGDLYLWVCLDS